MYILKYLHKIIFSANIFDNSHIILISTFACIITSIYIPK